MKAEPRFPHEVLSAYVSDRLGRLSTELQTLSDELFERVVHGLVEQLGCYLDCIPAAELRLGAVTLREGQVRSFLLAELIDRGGPLRLRDATRKWDMDGDTPLEAVAQTNARRWRFIDRYLSSLVEPLLHRALRLLTTYYAARPYAQVQCGLLRILEDVDRTYLCIEFDDRTAGLPTPKTEARTRYAVQ